MTDIQPFDHLKKQIILYRENFDAYTLEVKPLCLTRDITYIHRWVNMDYAKTFWQMEGSFGKTYRHYENILNAGTGYSLMFFLADKKSPVALMDIYFAKNDEIGYLYDMRDEDIGIHLLMGPPPRSPVASLTTNVMTAGLAFIFSLGVARIIGEPDAANKRANDLVKKVGFRFLKKVKMSYKTANLYILEKEAFLNQQKVSG